MALDVVRFALWPLLTSLAVAQCQLQWQPGQGTLGVQGSIGATVAWGEDGSGPIGPKVIVGGQFTSAGNVVARNLAAYDIATGACLPNCILVPAPEVIVLSLPVAGVARGDCGFANDPVWAGVLVQHQFLQGQLDPSFQLASLSSSNALVLTVGSY